MNQKLQDLHNALRKRRRSDPIPDKERELAEQAASYFMGTEEYLSMKKGDHPFFYLDRFGNMQLKTDYLQITYKDGEGSNEIQ